VDQQKDLVTEYFTSLWKYKIRIFLTSFIFTIVVAVYSLTLPDIYYSNLLLAPNDSNPNIYSSGESSIGGLAQLTGINLGSENLSKTDLALEVIRSKDFIYRFITENNLKPIIYAAVAWDKVNDIMIFDPNLYINKTNEWIIDEDNKTVEPSIFTVYEIFITSNLIAYKDTGTGLVVIGIKHISPKVVLQLTNKLFQYLNREMQQRDIISSTSRIDFLTKELESTKIDGMMDVFFRLIETNYKKLMIAKATNNYVFTILDSAVLAEKKAEPKRAIIVASAFFFFIMIFSIYYFFKSLRSEN